jgi:ketosteroid isomerase-like protein
MAEDFEQFLETRKKAALAYVNGDPALLSEIVAQHSPATFFSPMGDITEAASAVAARYEKDAGAFDKGSSTELEILHCASSGDLGYWVGYQLAEVRMKGKPEPITMKLRITEIFLREHGAWKMIHRHADMPKAKD